MDEDLSQPLKLFITRVDGRNGRIAQRAYHSFDEAMKGHWQVCGQVFDTERPN